MAGCSPATSAGFLNSQRLKGIHLAIKSGMLAAETARLMHCSAAMLLAHRNCSSRALQNSRRCQLDSRGTLPCPQFSSGFRARAMGRCMAKRSLCNRWMCGANFGPDSKSHPGLQEDAARRRAQLFQRRSHAIPRRGQRRYGKLTFDKLQTDVYYSGTRHEVMTSLPIS